jgi:hypothetical protein
MNEMEIKKEQLAKMVKYGLIGLFCAVAAPVAWLAVTGIAGMLAALGVAAVGYNLAPVVALKLANYKYRALDAERVDHIIKVQDAAAENPIETLQLEYDARYKSTDRFKQGITEFRTEIKNYQDQVKQFETEYPEDAKSFKEQLAAMMANLQAREDKYKAVQAELVKFDNTIKRMRAMWKMALATQKMNKLAGMNTGDEFARIKTEAAVDSVMSGVNKAFAEMETEMMVNKKAQPALTNNPSPVLIVDATVTQKVSV